MPIPAILLYHPHKPLIHAFFHTSFTRGANCFNKDVTYLHNPSTPHRHLKINHSNDFDEKALLPPLLHLLPKSSPDFLPKVSLNPQSHLLEHLSHCSHHIHSTCFNLDSEYGLTSEHPRTGLTLGTVCILDSEVDVEQRLRSDFIIGNVWSKFVIQIMHTPWNGCFSGGTRRDAMLLRNTHTFLFLLGGRCIGWLV